MKIRLCAKCYQPPYCPCVDGLHDLREVTIADGE